MHEVISTTTNHWSKTSSQILETAAGIVAERFVRGDAFCNPTATCDFLRFKLHQHQREVFAVMFLDSQHQLIEFNEVFFGTINAASVYPREVVKLVLLKNASAVIFAHNHPSGCAEPSSADRKITEKLTAALATIDVPVLDHIVVGKECVSFAERGWL
ncbi:DNA repair protein RadC [Shewanella intestini]|uniref:DNA repair protein RadC n=1 Tax=Shewanella intestini TaxID=2017544 RepID=A0ABS5I2R4_9GAMM|nr:MULTISPECIES: DNA repair protein RadC [Shewanella]MBR9728289.1 DNA repair protein RadC [Shewanella intestini]MRG35754.1 DNA repair protein RadC [Shewanella sp. XMDDZSB0408]